MIGKQSTGLTNEYSPEASNQVHPRWELYFTINGESRSHSSAQAQAHGENTTREF